MPKLSAADRAAADYRRRYLIKVEQRAQERAARRNQPATTTASHELPPSWWDMASRDAGADFATIEAEEREGQALVDEAHEMAHPVDDLPDSGYLDD